MKHLFLKVRPKLVIAGSLVGLKLKCNQLKGPKEGVAVGMQQEEFPCLPGRQPHRLWSLSWLGSGSWLHGLLAVQLCTGLAFPELQYLPLKQEEYSSQGVGVGRAAISMN